MRVHVVGLGKLGLPVALALEQAGHEVSGWDASAQRRDQIRERTAPEAPHEPHLAEYLAGSRIGLAPRVDMIRPEVIVVCVQTPHQPQFEGVTPLEEPPQDFDYTWLREAVAETVDDIGRAPGWDPLLVVVSTCLPGTFERELRPLLGGVRFAYHPLFIAMGSVIEDFRDPEFVLIGVDDPPNTAHELKTMYGPVHTDPRYCFPERFLPPYRVMSVTSAELTKVAYNAFIGQKLMLANGVAMTADAVGADCDDVMGTLKLATKRLVSDAYLTPGMGDGGGCHPRDQIALSWLANEHGLPHNPYAAIIEHREAHARWLADLWLGTAQDAALEPIMLGSAYKPNSTLQAGSHARLVAWHAGGRGVPITVWDTPQDLMDAYALGHQPRRACFFLATPHDWILNYPWQGVLVDPWGVYQTQKILGIDADLTVIRPGRRA